MPDMEVVIEDIRTSGTAACKVTDGVRQIDLAAFSQASAAMSGSKAARLYNQVEGKLGKQVTNIANGFEDLGENMHAAADLYQANEEAASKALTDGTPSSGGGMRPV